LAKIEESKKTKRKTLGDFSKNNLDNIIHTKKQIPDFQCFGKQPFNLYPLPPPSMPKGLAQNPNKFAVPRKMFFGFFQLFKHILPFKKFTRREKFEQYF
jgi:hypothetical protein